ncbi:MAG: cytochrome c biogenesis protein CcsA [Bryobacteraceae bacterium]
MKDRILWVLALLAAGILLWNMHTIFTEVPDEANQGAIFRIIYFHVPAAILALCGFGIGLAFSLIYLKTGNLRWDGIAEGVTEVSLVFASITLVTGSIWGRIIWGVWWAWDARLTSFLIAWLIFAGYLMLRRAIEEPVQRARLSAVVSVFGTVNAYVVWKSIEWFRTQHPGPVLSMRSGGGMAPGMEAPLGWNVLALFCISIMLVMVRQRQAGIAREIDTLRRTAHSF